MSLSTFVPKRQTTPCLSDRSLDVAVPAVACPESDKLGTDLFTSDKIPVWQLEAIARRIPSMVKAGGGRDSRARRQKKSGVDRRFEKLELMLGEYRYETNCCREENDRLLRELP